MKPIYLFVVAIVLSSCVHLGERVRGNGNRETVEYSLEDFDEIDIGGNFSVQLVPSSKNAVSITTDENLIDYIEVEVRGDRLHVDSDEFLDSEDGNDMIIYYQEIEEFSISGACEVKSDETVEANELKISMSGAGYVELDIDVKELDIDISGAGAVDLEGTADYQEISMSGAGSYEAFDLVSQSTKIRISGVGGANIFVEKDLDAEISGFGGVKYKGEPLNVQQNVSGVGKLTDAH